MNKVSTRLLQKILNKNVYWICDGSPENRIGYSSDSSASIGGRAGFGVNTYEFMHMCKEWAYSNNYYLMSGPNQFGVYKCFTDTITNMPTITAKTEPEAIFTACEWILNKQ